MSSIFGRFFIYVCLATTICACASIGTPGGGPRDETPPQLVKANPEPGATNTSRRNVILEFDEIVNVKDAFSNVTVSPVGSSVPRVSALGRRVTVAFQDSLLPNTTYVVDFGDAIQDNNEGNPLKNFSYTFSTGATIDTLRISGMVLGASNLEPQQKMLVGIHSSEADSAFSTLKLERVTKTDDRGRFTIRGLKPGSYRVFALADINNDFRWDNPAEDIAFLDYTVFPAAEQVMITDTIFNPITGMADSVFSHPAVKYTPNDILLQSFNINYKPQYLLSHERPDSASLKLTFNAPATSLPIFKIIFPDTISPARIEHSPTNDTITYWLSGKSLLSADTIKAIAQYARNKSRGVYEEASDTLSFIIKKKNKTQARTPKNLTPQEDSILRAQPPYWLTMQSPGTAVHSVDKPKLIEFSVPIDTIYPDAIKLEIKVDTIWVPVDKKLTLIDSLTPRLYGYEAPWQFDSQYRITADSIAAKDIAGYWNKPFTTAFRTHAEADYRLVQLNISGLPDSIPAFVEILGSGEKVEAKADVKGGRAEFPYLTKGTYYARLIADVNGNGIWDTGDYDQRRQPEQVYYLPKAINLKGSMDRYLDWDINIAPVDAQKPDAIKKNKPTSNKRITSNAANTTEEDNEEE